MPLLPKPASLLVLSLCALTALTAQAYNPEQSIEQPDQLILAKALNAYEDGRLQDAEPSLLLLAKKYPDNLELVELIGSAYAEQDRVDEALPYFQSSVRLAPRQAVTHANLGATFSKLGRHLEALRELQIAVALDPRSVANQSNLGHELILLHEPRLAAKAFASASSLSPGDSDALYNWALSLYTAGAFAEATSALRSFPATVFSDQMHELAGDANEKSGDFKQALIHYEAAANLNPSDSNLYALTLELLRHWTWNTAEQVAAYGASLYPSSAHFKVAEGIAQYAKNDYVNAATTFAHLLSSYPDSVLYADLLGHSCSLLAEGTVSGCIELEAFAHRYPENAQAATYAATAILRRPVAEQDLLAAQTMLDQAIAANPQLAEAYYEQAVLDQQLLRWQKSVVDLEHAVRLRPSYAEAHYRLARAYAHTGESERSRKEMTLQQQYSAAEKERLDLQLKAVTTFVIENQPADSK